MTVAVRNLQSGETYEVGPDGAVFGREGGPANIKVPDQSVSKKHARIFSDGTAWFLEDMDSVNGTLIEGSRIAGPQSLKAGIVFQMSKFRFEVVSVDGRGVQVPPASLELETRTSLRGNSQGLPQGGANLASDLRKDSIPKRKPTRESASPPSRQAESTHLRNNLPLASDGDFPSQYSGDMGGELPNDQAQSPVPAIDSDYEGTSPAGALAVGIGYLLKTAPLLVLNPLGTVRKQIQNPPLAGMQKVALAFLSLPVLGFTAVAQTLVGGLAAAIATGTLPIVSLITTAVIAVVVAVVFAVASGFVSHPVLGWLVNKLGGTSDARSRTTHIAMVMVTTLVLLAPSMLIALLTSIVARLSSVSSVFALINIVPALLMIVAIPLPALVQWFWFRSYNVVKWFQTLWLVFAVVLGVLGVFAAISTALDAVKVMGAGPGNVVVVPLMPIDPTMVIPPESPTNQGDVKVPVSGSPEDPPQAPLKNLSDTLGKVPPLTITDNAGILPTRVVGDYGDYLRKRAAIEAALEKNPLLIRNENVKRLYAKLSQDTYVAEQEALGPKKKRTPASRLLVEKERTALVFEMTTGTVNELYNEKALALP